MSSSSAVARRCRTRLAELRDQGFEVPRPFDVDEVCRRVSDCLGRAITPIGIEMPPGAPYGMTFFTDADMIVVYERRTTPVHRDHIVAHEIAHIVFGHQTLELTDDDATRALLPALRPGLVHRVLGRTGAYDRVAEQEAETMATLLLEEATRPGPRDDDRRRDRDGDEVYERLRHAFEHPDQ